MFFGSITQEESNNLAMQIGLDLRIFFSVYNMTIQ